MKRDTIWHVFSLHVSTWSLLTGLGRRRLLLSTEETSQVKCTRGGPVPLGPPKLTASRRLIGQWSKPGKTGRFFSLHVSTRKDSGKQPAANLQVGQLPCIACRSGSRRVPSEPLAVPSEFQASTPHLPAIQSEFQAVPSSSKQVPSEFQASFKQFPAVPSKFQAVPSSSKRVPNSSKRVPSEF